MSEFYAFSINNHNSSLHNWQSDSKASNWPQITTLTALASLWDDQQITLAFNPRKACRSKNYHNFIFPRQLVGKMHHLCSSLLTSLRDRQPFSFRNCFTFFFRQLGAETLILITFWTFSETFKKQYIASPTFPYMDTREVWSSCTWRSDRVSKISKHTTTTTTTVSTGQQVYIVNTKINLIGCAT